MSLVAFTILGLPAHPLIVHGAVVGIPLAALTMIAYAVRPAWRPYLYWPAVVVVASAWILSILAGSTGETLEHALKETSLIEEHAEWADRLGLAVHAFSATALVALAVDFWRARRPGAVPSAATIGRRVALPASAVLAVACLVLVGIVGHLGAKAAWHDSPAASASMQAAP